MPDELPFGQCIGELTDSQKLAAIYGVITEKFDVSAPILGNQCIEEVYDSIKLAAIYQALNAIPGTGGGVLPISSNWRLFENPDTSLSLQRLEGGVWTTYQDWP